MPVYNGEAFLSQAIDSLLSQDHKDFQLIISDNASTDKTREICQYYEEKDERIRYLRSDKNHGPVWNFIRVFELSDSDYFMWAAHDDFWDHSYIRSCLEGFNESRDIVLVGTICTTIYSESGQLYLVDQGFSTIGLSPRERFIRYNSVIHSGTHIGAIFYGLYKREALKKTMPPKNTIALDHVILSELCFQGEILTVQKPLMVKRWGGSSASIESIANLLGITSRFVITFPYLNREVFLQKAILQTNSLTLAEKLRLSVWSLWNYVRLEARLKNERLLPRLNSLVGKLRLCINRPVKGSIRFWRNLLLK